MSSGIEGRPVHVTLDIDVLDPAYACATGTLKLAAYHQEMIGKYLAF